MEREFCGLRIPSRCDTKRLDFVEVARENPSVVHRLGPEGFRPVGRHAMEENWAALYFTFALASSGLVPVTAIVRFSKACLTDAILCRVYRRELRRLRDLDDG